jgi:prevent-host-death family protein
VDIRQARTQLSRLIERATDGEEIIITKSGKPVARLVPYTPKGAVRRPGTMRGKIRIKKNSTSLFRKSFWFRSAMDWHRL